jgi:hypothetical protein
MPFALEQLTQALTVLGKMDPASTNAGTTQPITDIDMSKVRRVMFIINIGSVGGAGTVDVSIKESKTAGGSYQALTNAVAITQVTTSNKIVTVELRDDQLDAGYRYVQVNLTIGANAVVLGMTCLGGEAEAKPAKAQDIAAVAQRLVAPNAP